MNKRFFRLYLFLLFSSMSLSAIAQSLKERVSFEVGASHNTNLLLLRYNFFYSNVLGNEPKPSDHESFNRSEFRFAINYLLGDERTRLTLFTFLGRGRLFHQTERVSQTEIRQIGPMRTMWTPGLQLNRNNRKGARYASYYGVGLHLINVGQRFETRTQRGPSGSTWFEYTEIIEKPSISFHGGRSIAQKGVLRKLMLEARGELLPGIGDVGYIRANTWFRAGVGVFYRFGPAASQ